MYADHFGLNEKPFSISPDPRYLYLSPRHADALAHLLYGVADSGGFIQLTGEVGTGKTTLIRSLLGQLPEHTEVALILNPQLSTKQFLQAICTELGVPFVQKDTARMLVDRLNTCLLELHAAGKRAVLIVDEAQTMSPELLEQVRLLTNLETEKQKLLQIILIGQPELRLMLARQSMRQIAQRITGRYHLEPLTAADTRVYVRHRIKVAGGRPDVFSPRAVQRLYRLARGVPRLINVIADRALLAAFSRDELRVGPKLVSRSADEVFGRSRETRWWPWAAAVAGFTVLVWITSATEDATVDTLELAMLETPASSDAVPAAAAADALPASGNIAPAAAAAAPPTLEDLFADDDLEPATAALFRLWQADYRPDRGAPCTEAEAQGLRCLVLDGGSISEIRELDRPARLELVGADGQRHHVVLLGLGEHEATVLVGGETRLLPIAELGRFTFGSHLVLWRPAVDTSAGPLARGTRSPGVIWLRTTLESIGIGGTDSAEPELFDAALAAAVRSYQHDRGLQADGIAGDRTLATLQAEIGLVGVRLEPGAH